MKRAELELQASFVVLIILTAFALLFGLIFLVHLWGSSHQIASTVSADYRTFLEARLSHSVKGAVMPKTIYLSKSHAFNIGIKNLMNETKSFKVNYTIVTPGVSPNVVLLPIRNFKLKPNQVKLFSMDVKRIKVNSVIVVISVSVNSTNGWVEYYTEAVKAYK